MKRTSVNIAYWNINCLKSKMYDKSNDSVFLKEISPFDIVCLTEIKCNMTQINFEGYKTHVVQRKVVHKGPMFGGIAILIKQSIRLGVKFMPTSSSEYQWIKLRKDFFGFEKDIYVCCLYYSPRNSTYSNNSDIDILSLIGADLLEYSKVGNALLCGDFNARTGCKEADFIVNDNVSHIPVSDTYQRDTNIDFRNSQDHVIDTRGRELLELCIESQLRILNGRTFGDSQGMFTSYKYNGNSVVDYILASECLLSQILYFNVSLNIPSLSDHSKICCKIFANYSLQPINTLAPLPVKYKWSSISTDKFKDSLCSNVIKEKISNFLSLESDAISVDFMMTKLNDIIVSAADASLHKKTNKKTNRLASKKWYDTELYKLRRMLDQKGYLYAKSPNDPHIRGSYYKFRKVYVKSCKRKRNEYKTTTIQKLEELNKNDPKAYWKLLDDLKREDSVNTEPQISSNEWVDHFSNLNTINDKFNSRVEEISKLLSEQEKLREFTEIDFQITPEELFQSLTSLKNNKAVGLDVISNEMLKCAFSSLQNCLLKLFNTVLANGTYPSIWKKAYITPLHKGGSLDDPNNYRGIAILSCTAKLFNSILTKRLDDFLDSRSIINPVQIGFTKKARTSDHMFVLRTLIEKYTKDANTKMYTCFIDFHKAFDRVLHNMMLYKLSKLGISSNFYDVIKDMYANNHLTVKMKHGLTQYFSSSIGVRQGDTLSPDLFKIFINDLPDVFDDSCYGVDVGSYHLSCLLYADDVILVSKTAPGLQRCINKLEEYCDQWCLEVNLDKSKVLIFNKSGKLLNTDFVYKGKNLECVREYTYLGVTFCISGAFSTAASELYKKALKGIFKLKSIFGNCYPNVSTALHIFDHTIKPILTYGSEIWGSFNKNVKRSDNTIDKLYANLPGEKLQLKFCKYILGVHTKASNLATMGELGRFPIYIDICENVIKFHNYVQQKDKGSLLGQAMQTSVNLHNSGSKSWYTGVQNIFNELNCKMPRGDSLKRNLRYLYKTFWFNKLHEEGVQRQGKLRTYSTFKYNFEKEIYIDRVSDACKRKCLTQLRISAHRLEIEAGRYKNKQACERICKSCDLNQVEDEIHFLSSCSLYNSERDIFFQYVTDKVHNFNSLDASSKMIWLMTCEDLDIIDAFANFVHTCFNLRKSK